jgi:hypothetical protein
MILFAAEAAAPGYFMRKARCAVSLPEDEALTVFKNGTSARKHSREQICRSCHLLATVIYGDSMLDPARLTAIASIGAVLIGVSFSPAHALKIPERQANSTSDQRQGVTAYADDSQGPQLQKASILSPAEIRHIQWCAARYNVEYDATNDTYAGSSGTRLQCHSPR